MSGLRPNHSDAEVQRVAQALFGLRDSENATDWYRQRLRLYRQARDFLNEEGSADRCLELLRERYPDGAA